MEKKEKKNLVPSILSFTYNVFKNFLSHCLQNSRLCSKGISWLDLLGFNATLTAKVISWRPVTHMCFLAFSHQYLHNSSYQSRRLLFSHASVEVRGENTPERKFASTGSRSHDHQVISPTCSPLSLPGWALTLSQTSPGFYVSEVQAF